MAIGNHNDLTHIVRTSDQWKNTYDKYELIPSGVLCVELVSSDVTKIKIGDGHNIFSKLPYIGDLDLSKYYTKLETDTRIKEILTQEKVVRIKGLIGSKSDLPADARCGDIYFVRQLSSSDNKYIEYIYSPDNTWEPLGGIPVDIDLSEYAKTAYVDDKIEQVNERIDDIEQHGTHTHPNKEILDQITEPYTTADKETLASLHNYDDTEIREMISQSSHTHSNKDILDATSAAFTKEDKSKLDQLNPYDDSILKEKIQALERLAHEHSNKRILDQTTASFTKEYERKMRWIRLYTGCTGMEEGIAGLVPAAQAGEEDYVLSGSGEWVPQTGGGGTYELPIASASVLGGIKVGDGLEIDENGVLSATGSSGDSITEGGGINITTDPQTGVKTISVNVGDNLEVDPNTGELNVTGVDYTAGKGIFIGNEYQNIEYIKNSGNYDQIILTDIVPNFSDKLEMDIKFGAATGNTTNDAFIGCYNIHDTNEYMYTAYIYCVSDLASIAYYNHFKWTEQLGNINMIYNPMGISYDGSTSQRMTLTLQSSSGTWGSQSVNFPSAFDSNFIGAQRGIAIFGSIGTSHGSTTDEFDYVDSMELTIYGVKLYDSNDTLLHNLVPVKKLSNNEGGLYDTVTNKFYGNSGNGSFVTGPAIETDDRIINAKIGNGLDFDSNNAIEVVTGDGLSINASDEVELKKATSSTLGGVIVGDNIDVSNGTISVPKAALNKLGVVKPTDGLSIDSNGVLSVDTGDGLSIDSTTKEVNVNIGDGLSINQDNEVEVSLGDGLQFDSNDAIEVNVGDGLVIDSNDNTLNVNIGSGLEIDSVTGAINVIGGGGNSGNYIEGEAIEFEEGASRLPTGYTELENISNISASYIDTGYIPNTDTQLSIIANIHRGTTSWQTLFGARDAVNPGGAEYAFFVRLNDNYNFYPRITGDQYTYMPNQTYDEKIRININNTTATVTRQDGSSYSYTQTGSLSNLSTTLAIFALHNQTGYVDNGIIDLYSFKIYENNTIVKDFVPCKRNSDDAIGLIDIINNVFYTNLGTGTFTAGRILTNTSINVKYGDGLTINQDNELEVNVGDGITVDANNKLTLDTSIQLILHCVPDPES